MNNAWYCLQLPSLNITFVSFSRREKLMSVDAWFSFPLEKCLAVMFYSKITSSKSVHVYTFESSVAVWLLNEARDWCVIQTMLLEICFIVALEERTYYFLVVGFIFSLVGSMHKKQTARNGFVIPGLSEAKIQRAAFFHCLPPAFILHNSVPTHTLTHTICYKISDLIVFSIDLETDVCFLFRFLCKKTGDETV